MYFWCPEEKKIACRWVDENVFIGKIQELDLGAGRSVRTREFTSSTSAQQRL